MKFQDFTTELGRLLRPEGFNDFCPNGLLVDPFMDGGHRIAKVATGVSLCDDLIDAAVSYKADALIVHHPNGFWKSEKDRRLVGTFGRYMTKLILAGIALYGYHLPLDAHGELGNNIGIFNKLTFWGNMQVSRFMEQDIGVIAKCTVGKGELSRVFPKGWQAFGPELETREYRVGICSGSGTSGLQAAVDLGCDMFITGEVRESTPIFARENRITVIAGGHHRSEVFGVRALAERIKDTAGPFTGCTARFIDIDNPI